LSDILIYTRMPRFKARASSLTNNHN